MTANFGTNHTINRLLNERTRGALGQIIGTDILGAPLEYDYFYASADPNNQQPIDFADTTTEEVKFEVAGGKCNRTLGTSIIEVRYPTCADTWVKEVELGLWSLKTRLPAQQFDVTLKSTTADTVDIGDTVTNYVHAKGVRTQTVDLSEDTAEVRWEYHPEPQFRVTLVGSPENPCDQLLLQRDRTATIKVEVYEEFWDGEAECTWIEGTVSVRNEIGEDQSLVDDLVAMRRVTEAQGVLLTNCREGCNLELQLTRYTTEHDTTAYKDAVVTVDTMAGEPEVVASVGGVQYAKLIEVRMNTGIYSVQETIPVVILGHKVISDKFTMDFPQYFPLHIMYDPPGGSSMAWYSNAEASFTIQSESFEVYAGA